MRIPYLPTRKPTVSDLLPVATNTRVFEIGKLGFDYVPLEEFEEADAQVTNHVDCWKLTRLTSQGEADQTSSVTDTYS
jgi:hypothetical protein